ncbi:MAG: adenylate/guanylate cyclase domain-containing protein [Myxococcota bacterium]
MVVATQADELVQVLRSYVPSLVVKDRAERTPTWQRLPAAVLFADITGFTPLTERLAARGPAGAEELTRILNSYFAELVELIHVHGGDTVKFAGDALLALWPANGDLVDATLRAAVCGLRIQEALHNRDVADGVRLSLRLGIGAGSVVGAHVGGVGGRVEYVAAGHPLVQMTEAEHEAQAGDVVLASNAWSLVKDRATGEPREHGCVRLTNVPSAPAPRPLEIHEIHASATLLRPYIPSAILTRVEAGQTAWLAELRRVTVMFLNISGLDVERDDGVSRLQEAMVAIQSALERYEGTLNKLIVDDKGTTVVAGFGLPPMTHEDDAARAIQAATDIRTRLSQMGLKSSVGITTGRAFCGPMGGHRRREYTMMGDVVNLSARLMQAAAGNVLCDGATRQAAAGRVQFQDGGELQLKGKAARVAVFRPLGQEKVPSRSSRPLVGRAAERAQLKRLLGELRDGAGGVLVVQGEPGIGKSLLVQELVDAARGVNVQVLSGTANALEKSTPYHAWSAVFRDILALTDDVPVEAQAARVRQDPDVGELAALLCDVLRVQIPETDATREWPANVRAEETQRLLIQLLQRHVKGRPTLLVLEDAHWFDSASWLLARLAASRLPQVLLCLSSRPMTEPPPDVGRLLALPRALRLSLDQLSPEDTDALLQGRLRADRVDTEVIRVIHERAQGNPFFTEELAHALVETGLLQVVDGVCRWTNSAVDLKKLQFPDTLQGVVTSRIDRLSATEQLALKAASVLGREFELRTLREIFPVEPERENLSAHLGHLERADLTHRTPVATEPSYFFKHIITQEVAYNLMLFSQRRQLHAATATWLERTHASNLPPYFELLAHHWREADIPARALEYLEKAGEHALGADANREALTFLSEATQLEANLSLSGAARGDDLHRARRQRLLGEAHLAMGNLVKAREHLVLALGILGVPLPVQPKESALAFARQVQQQVLHRVSRRIFADRPSGDHPRLLEGARIAARVGQIDYYRNEMFPAISAGLLSVNLAEGAGSSPELARAYSLVCIAAGLVPLHPLARLYFSLARQTAAGMPNSSAQAYVLFATSLYAIGVGEWNEVNGPLMEARRISERLNDRRERGKVLNAQGHSAAYQGRLKDAQECFTTLRTDAVRAGDVQQQTWARNGLAMVALRLGRLPEAVSEAEAGLVGADRSSEMVARGVLAIARWELGEEKLAEEHAQALLRHMEASKPTVYSTLQGYSAACEVFLKLWERGRADARAPAMRAVELMEKYATVFPVGKPRAQLWSSLALWLRGEKRGAEGRWRTGLATARELNMPTDQVLFHLEAARRLPATSPEREAALRIARDLQTLMGAAPHDEKLR